MHAIFVYTEGNFQWEVPNAIYDRTAKYWHFKCKFYSISINKELDGVSELHGLPESRIKEIIELE